MTALLRDDRNTPMPVLRYGTAHSIPVAGSSNSGSVYSTTDDVVVRIVATQDCHVIVGETPTATASHTFLPAGYVEYIGIPANHTIAVVRSTADGALHVTELE